MRTVRMGLIVMYALVFKKTISIVIPETELTDSLRDFIKLIKYNIETITINRIMVLFFMNGTKLDFKIMQNVLWNFMYVLLFGKPFYSIIMFFEVLIYVFINSFEAILGSKLEKGFSVRIKIYFKMIIGNLT